MSKEVVAQSLEEMDLLQHSVKKPKHQAAFDDHGGETLDQTLDIEMQENCQSLWGQRTFAKTLRGPDELLELYLGEDDELDFDELCENLTRLYYLCGKVPQHV